MYGCWGPSIEVCIVYRADHQPRFPSTSPPPPRPFELSQHRQYNDLPNNAPTAPRKTISPQFLPNLHTPKCPPHPHNRAQRGRWSPHGQALRPRPSLNPNHKHTPISKVLPYIFDRPRRIHISNFQLPKILILRCLEFVICIESQSLGEGGIGQ